MLYLRSQLQVRAAPEFEAWLERMEMTEASGRIRQIEPRSARFLALADKEVLDAG